MQSPSRRDRVNPATSSARLNYSWFDSLDDDSLEEGTASQAGIGAGGQSWNSTQHLQSFHRRTNPLYEIKQLHAKATSWPFPFPSSTLERQYLRFSAPAVLIPPVWCLLFCLYVLTALTNTGSNAVSEEACPEVFPTIRSIWYLLLAAGALIAVGQIVVLLLQWLLLRSTTAEDSIGASTTTESLLGASSNTMHSFSESLGGQTELSAEESPPASRRHTHSELIAHRFHHPKNLRLLDTLYLILRTVQLYCVLIEALNRALQLWVCSGPSRSFDVSLVSSSIPFFTGTLILRGSLKWDIPRFILLPLGNTIISSIHSHVQASKGFSNVFMLWLFAVIFLCIAWDAERESRSRFLLSKALTVLRFRCDYLKMKAARTLRSICDEAQLQMYLTGIPLRDESPCCYILIITIHDYVLWRQQTTVAAGMRCVDRLQRELERLRHNDCGSESLVLQCVRGDECIASLGLRTSETSAPHAVQTDQGAEESAAPDRDLLAENPLSSNNIPITQSTFGQLDPSPIVLFAYHALSVPRVLAAKDDLQASGAGLGASFNAAGRKGRGIQTANATTVARTASVFSSLVLQLGLGYGACSGALLPGRGAHYVLSGPAFSAALENHRTSQPGTLELPTEVAKGCQKCSLQYRAVQGPNPTEARKKVRVLNVRVKRNLTQSQKRLEPSSTGTNTKSEDGTEGSSTGSPAAAFSNTRSSDPGPGSASRSKAEEGFGSEDEPSSVAKTIGSGSPVASLASPAMISPDQFLSQQSRFDRPLPGAVSMTANLEERPPNIQEPSSTVDQSGARENSIVNLSINSNSEAGGHLMLRSSQASQSRSFEASPPGIRAAPPSTEAPPTSVKIHLRRKARQLAAIFNPCLAERLTSFVDERLTRKAYFILACWFGMFMVFTIPSTNEEGGNSSALALQLCLLGVLLAFWGEIWGFLRIRRRPQKGRWQVFILGMIQYGVTVVLSVVSEPNFSLSFGRNFPALLWNLVFCMTSIDGIPLCTSLPVSVGFHLFTVTYRGVDRISLGMRALSFAPPIMIPIIQASLIHSEYEQLENLIERKAAAEHDRQAHERALNMVIPSYIASHVAKLDALGEGKVVSEVLVDAAILVVRVETNASTERSLQLMTSLQALIDSCADISLIHADGDLMTISGPLVRPKPGQPHQQRWIASANPLRFQHIAAELVANQASENVLLVLSFLCRECRTGSITAVLHRGDGVAVVFRRRRPVFAIEGVVAEVARSVLQQLPTGSICLTQQFWRMYPRQEDFKDGSLRVMTAPSSNPEPLRFQLRIRGTGYLLVHYLIRSQEVSEQSPKVAVLGS
jgi:hypothetical protein